MARSPQGRCWRTWPSEAGHPRRLYLLLESLQQRGSLRLSRGDPEHAVREAHGARSITWLNPALLD
jgi:hypothetical protein